MGSSQAPYPFSHVDAHPDPRRLIDTLYGLRSEAFYVSYKQRLLELLRAGPGQRFLDVGAGTGDAAGKLCSTTGAEVVACDLAKVMCAEMRKNGLRHVAVADVQRLPFRDAAFDGAWADRVLQHVEDPGRALGEMVRVVRPGGRIVVFDPDSGTQALNIEDHRLAARVLSLRQTVSLRHSTVARRVPGILTALGLQEIQVETRTLLVRDRKTVDRVMSIRGWADTFADLGHLERAEARRFNTLLDDAIRRGTFLYSVTYFLTSATVTVTGHREDRDTGGLRSANG
ncbi:methyltransferase domain-containing protein [Streptomyces cinnamoneus]|uniref:methyltransferase domain-containing protein n=1 Tax=Streptomyces cinnamoneus TaxID=53446 RepID=UPI00341D2CB7